MPGIENSEFISLLHTLLVKLKREDSSLVALFFSYGEKENEVLYSSLLSSHRFYLTLHRWTLLFFPRYLAALEWKDLMEIQFGQLFCFV